MCVFGERSGDRKWNCALEAQDLQTVISLVAGGMGVTITPSPYRSMPGVVMKPIEGLDLTLPVQLIWHKSEKSEMLEQFLAFFMDWMNRESAFPWR